MKKEQKISKKEINICEIKFSHHSKKECIINFLNNYCYENLKQMEVIKNEH